MNLFINVNAVIITINVINNMSSLLIFFYLIKNDIILKVRYQSSWSSNPGIDVSIKYSWVMCCFCIYLVHP